MTRPTVPIDEFAEDPPPPGRLVALTPWLAILALAAAGLALAFTFLGRGGDLASCRKSAWTAIPDTHDLPTGWNLGSTDMNANGMTISITGPATGDDSAAPPVVYASITCYGDVASTALAQNRAAAEMADATVTLRTGGSDAYDIDNPSAGVTTVFRVGPLVGQVADAGSASEGDRSAIVLAVAIAMGDKAAAGTAAVQPSDAAAGSQDPNASGAEPTEPAASSVAPELEAKLPTEVAGATLSVDSATADVFLGSFPNSAALATRIRALGAAMTDVQVAEAFDPNGTIDLNLYAFRLPGKDVAKLRAAIIETWLSANQTGVTKTDVTLAGKKLTRIDYGADIPTQYVYTGTDYVITIETSDTAIATEVAGKIK
jgi:hypothetical protein